MREAPKLWQMLAGICCLNAQVAQVSWHGKNDVLMWSVLLSVLFVAAVRHLLETSSSQQESSLAGIALCWLCISIAALVTFQ